MELEVEESEVEVVVVSEVVVDVSGVVVVVWSLGHSLTHSLTRSLSHFRRSAFGYVRERESCVGVFDGGGRWEGRCFCSCLSLFRFISPYFSSSLPLPVNTRSSTHLLPLYLLFLLFLSRVLFISCSLFSFFFYLVFSFPCSLSLFSFFGVLSLASLSLVFSVSLVLCLVFSVTCSLSRVLSLSCSLFH